MSTVIRNRHVIGLRLLVLIMAFCLISCAATQINQVEQKWGPPARVEKLDGNSIYYWHFYKGRAIVGGRNVMIGHYTEGLVTYEYTVDEAGTIIHQRKYWKQPD
jgi:hypothetical protein